MYILEYLIEGFNVVAKGNPISTLVSTVSSIRVILSCFDTGKVSFIRHTAKITPTVNVERNKRNEENFYPHNLEFI